MTDPKDQEIERLRSWLHRVLYETGCTRGQHTTQWCEEARVTKDELKKARAEIERLKAELAKAKEAT